MTTKNRNQSRRQDSLNSYVDGLVQKYSKLDVVRLDLSYKKKSRNDVTHKSFDKDLRHLYNNQRSNSIFDNVIGYIIKVEQGDKRNNHLHAHTIFFIDGQKSKDSSAYSVAKKIGKYWSENITKGEGSYHNCNMKKYVKNGLGRITYDDQEKIKILKENILPYHCKDEQSAKTKDYEKIKVLRRGVIPKQTNKGRPRKLKQNKDN